jgi:uncharacterized membrane protein
MAEATEKLKDKISENGDGAGSALSGMTSKDKLMPALATAAAAAAAGLVATKGPDLMKKLSGEANEEAEEMGGKAAEGAKKQLGQNGGLMGKAASKLMGGGGGGGGSQKGGKTRRLPIQRWTDVAVPVEKAYDAWTQFEEFPKFMHRVLEVKPNDDEEGDVIHWREKIWFSTREWDGEITERRKNDRIAWKSTSGTQHSGVISFHKLDDNLPRVMVDVDFLPSGILEKMASGLRFAKRAVQADLARFKAYVEFGDANELEYKSSPAEMEQNEGADDDSDGDDEGGDQQEAESRGDDDSDDSSDEDRENERKERESRREERKKAMSSS